MRGGTCMCNPKGLARYLVRGLQNSLYTPLEWSFTGEVKPISDFVRGSKFRIYSIGISFYWGILNDSRFCSREPILHIYSIGIWIYWEILNDS